MPIRFTVIVRLSLQRTVVDFTVIRTNRLMSDIRVGVEWSFGKLISKNKFVTYGQSMKLQGSPVSKYYHVAVLLTNAHTCMYGCQQTTYFGIMPPDVNEYFNQ